MMAAEQSNGLEIEVIFNSLIQIDSKQFEMMTGTTCSQYYIIRRGKLR